MPTGYTAKLHKGEPQTFPEFILSCARAMGALIIMREDPADTPIPEKVGFSTSFEERMVSEDETRIAELERMTDDEKRLARDAEFLKQTEERAESLRRAEAIRERYQDMLLHVLNWEPPTPEHEGLKDFMRQQLEQSIRFDCGVWPTEPPKLISEHEWYGRQIETAYASLARHRQQLEESTERERNRQAWVDALRNNLKQLS